MNWKASCRPCFACYHTPDETVLRVYLHVLRNKLKHWQLIFM